MSLVRHAVEWYSWLTKRLQWLSRDNQLLLALNVRKMKKLKTRGQLKIFWDIAFKDKNSKYTSSDADEANKKCSISSTALIPFNNSLLEGISTYDIDYENLLITKHVIELMVINGNYSSDWMLPSTSPPHIT